MVSICIIDDGVYIENSDIKLTYNLEFDSGNNLISQFEQKKESDSHGTVCFKIISKYSRQTDISSIKLSKGRKLRSNIEQLNLALDFCIQTRFDIISMSIGSTFFKDFAIIKSHIDAFTNMGSIVVAACNNRNIFTVPACLPNVIGVCTKATLTGDEFLSRRGYCDGIDYLASSRHMIKGRITPLGNSYAVPLITAKVCQFISENPKTDINEVRNYLDRNAANYDGESRTRHNFIHTNPAELDNWYGSVRKVHDIKNPVVCIYDYPLDELITIRELFIEDGYNCLAITNILRENFLETEYINFSNESIVDNALRALNTVYNPDLLIVGIYGLPNFDITEYIDADVVCKDGVITTDEGDILKINRDLFSQLYLILGEEEEDD